MELVAGAAGRALGNDFVAHPTSGCVKRCAIEISHTIEQAGRADECIECAALLVLLGVAVCRAAAAERRGQRCANHTHAGQSGAQPCHALNHSITHGLERSIAVFTEVVDTFEPDHC